MKKIFCSSILAFSSFAFAQWTPIKEGKTTSKSTIKEKYYTLDLNSLRQKLKPNTAAKHKETIEIAVPTGDGVIERFAVYSNPVAVKSLEEKYGIGSYSGVGIDDPKKSIRFSISPYGFQSMVIKNGKYEFVEPTEVNGSTYSLHAKTPRSESKVPFCTTKEHHHEFHQEKNPFSKSINEVRKTSDRKFRTLRLAISTTGEYTTYFGGVPQAVAAINATMTRVNGIFERDFATKLILQDFTNIIYTNASTDPYSNANRGADEFYWSSELMNVLSTQVGDENFDIGHLFSASGGGGFAGNIGNICSNDKSETPEGLFNYKGTAFTSPANGRPFGDLFDIDFVAHEMGHQLGANHTFSYSTENTRMNVEPGSGSTIMGYAGITDADVQLHSDSYFNTVSIAQILNTLQSVNCDIETPINNTPPTIKPLTEKTIPKQTAFLLTAEASDNEGDSLTYTWEQVDSATSDITSTTGNNTDGALFRSLPPSSSPTRFFPKFSRVLQGSLTNPTDWESVSNIARETNFTVTIRDNHPSMEQQQISTANQKIIVGNDGPFRVVNAEIYNNTPTPINWAVANTNASPYNVSNVKIDYSTDGGNNWVTLSESTPNDGTEILTFPSSLALGTEVFVRVSAIDNVFYALNKTKVSTAMSCSDGSSINISSSYITQNSAQISWNYMANASYLIRYKEISKKNWTEKTLNTNFIELTNLQEGSVYEIQVAPICSGKQQGFSKSSLIVTSSAITNCTTTSYDSADEYISNVTLANLNHTSTNNNFTDYSSDASKIIFLKPSETYTLSVQASWSGNPQNKAIKAWIDFNRNGSFENSEMVLSSPNDKNALATSSFTIPNGTIENKALKMRVMLKYNDSNISPCSDIPYGEVEDYSVIINAWQNIKAQEPTIVKNPAINTLQISNIEDNTPYKLYDMSGRLIRQGILSEGETSISDLTKAIYVVSFTYNGKNYNLKFAKH